MKEGKDLFARRMRRKKLRDFELEQFRVRAPGSTVRGAINHPELRVRIDSSKFLRVVREDVNIAAAGNEEYRDIAVNERICRIGLAKVQAIFPARVQQCKTDHRTLDGFSEPGWHAAIAGCSLWSNFFKVRK